MSDPVEDGVRLLRSAFVPTWEHDGLAQIVRRIIAPAVQAERERIRTGVEALDPVPGAPYVEGYDDPEVPLVRVLAVIDGGSGE